MTFKQKIEQVKEATKLLNPFKKKSKLLELVEKEKIQGKADPEININIKPKQPQIDEKQFLKKGGQITENLKTGEKRFLTKEEAENIEQIKNRGGTPISRNVKERLEELGQFIPEFERERRQAREETAGGFEERQRETEQKLNRPVGEQLEGFKRVIGEAELGGGEPQIGTQIIESVASSLLGRQEFLGFKFSVGTDEEIDLALSTLQNDQLGLRRERINVLKGASDETTFLEGSFERLRKIDEAEEDIKQQSILSGKLVDVEAQINVISALNAQRRFILTEQDAVIQAIRTGKLGQLTPEQEIAALNEPTPEPFEF